MPLRRPRPGLGWRIAEPGQTRRWPGAPAEDGSLDAMQAGRRVPARLWHGPRPDWTAVRQRAGPATDCRRRTERFNSGVPDKTAQDAERTPIGGRFGVDVSRLGK